jgi:glycosyltransferase involved in cell wall biosynthesis
VLIPTRNPNPEYLEQTLRSVLDQDPGPAAMQIEVIDDCSTRGDPESLVKTLAGRRVAFFRQPVHGGLAANWNSCIDRADGVWIHILHQDDVVRPGFYERLRSGIGTMPSVGAAFCRDTVIDADGRQKWSQPLIRNTPGIVDDWVEHIFVSLHLRASALVVKRSTYDALGGFSSDLKYALDWDMWKRIAASHAMWYEPEILACCRRHTGSASSGFLRSGANIAEIRRSIELSEEMLDPAVRSAVSVRARRYYTHYAAVTAWRAFMAGDVVCGFSQLREARKLTSALAVFLSVAHVLRRMRRIPR